MEITDLLIFTRKNNASDLHLSTQNPPILRINGEMVPYKTDPLTSDDIKQMLFSIMTQQQRSDYERDLEIDFAISFGENMRFRVNAFNTLRGPAAALRHIPSHIKTLDELKSPDLLKKLCMMNKGLILVTGPTGSGKSTTLAAMVEYINESTSKHIITIEDPVEFVHDSKKSLINQREVGSSTRSFSMALKSALREDPDVILVGELRDIETMQLALTAAETGHLVMATLHTNSAPKTIDRIIDVFPSDDKEMIRAMLSVSLEAVITQSLLKSKDSKRVAAYEIMLGTSAVRNLIREGKVHQLHSLIQVGSKMGMVTMYDSIMKLLDDGQITDQIARAALATSTRDDSDNLSERARAAATNATMSDGF